MSGKSEIIKKIKLIENIHDRDDFINEFKKVLEGIKKVSEGFLEIADGLNKIGRKKYYQELGYKTFESFCNDIFAGKNFLLQKIDIIDRQIDELVYNLYGLSAEEIGIAEGKVKFPLLCKNL